MKYELVIIWYDGVKNINEYDDEDKAYERGAEMKSLFGEQIEWWCVRPKEN